MCKMCEAKREGREEARCAVRVIKKDTEAFKLQVSTYVEGFGRNGSCLTEDVAFILAKGIQMGYDARKKEEKCKR